jgi:hypothetical protein
MTQQTRDKLTEALWGTLLGISPATDEMVAQDVDKLAPIILEIERQAENRGRFALLLEQAYAEQVRQDLAAMSNALPGELTPF